VLVGVIPQTYSPVHQADGDTVTALAGLGWFTFVSQASTRQKRSNHQQPGATPGGQLLNADQLRRRADVPPEIEEVRQGFAPP
jgi:hypothetical protein